MKIWTSENYKKILYGVITLVIGFVITMSCYHLWGTDIRVPIAGYRGDSVGLLLEVNNIVRGGTIHNNAVFGAPDIGGYRNIMADYTMMFPTIRLFWKLSGSVEAAVNIQLIFNHLILGLCMYLVCIRLKLSEKMAAVTGILMSNTPFLILGYNVIMLTYVYCFYLPFFAYYVIKMMMPQKEEEKVNFAEIFFLMLFMFFTGVNSLYYAFFCLIVLAFVGIYTLCGLRSVKNTLMVIVSYLAIGYGIAVCIMPNVLHTIGLGQIWDSGMFNILSAVIGLIIVGFVFLFYQKIYPSMTMKKLILILLGLGVILGLGLLMVSRFTDYMGEYDGRTLYAVELGALNITNLFLPAPNNIFSGLDKMVAVLTDIDNPQACDATEMGVLTGIGLLYSILHVFRFQKTEDIREQILEICGKCNCFLILLAVKGGLASVIASYITTGIRNYNRVAIIIMVFSLISFGILMDKLAETIAAFFAEKKRMVIASILWAAVLLGIVISVPMDYIYNHNFGVLYYEQRKEEYDEWQDIVMRIEDSVEAETMILEFPASIEGAHLGELMTVGRAYELSIPAIVSKETIWSYTSGLKTELDALEETEAYIDLAAESGFGGIYLDTMMYADNSYIQYIEALQEVLGEPVVSDGHRRYFWLF